MAQPNAKCGHGFAGLRAGGMNAMHAMRLAMGEESGTGVEWNERNVNGGQNKALTHRARGENSC